MIGQAVSDAAAGLVPLPDDQMRAWRDLSAAQQPDWRRSAQPYAGKLAGSPGLVPAAEVGALRSLLAEAAAGRAVVLQAGDCAEDPAHCVPGLLEAQAGLLDLLGRAMAVTAGLPAITVGRIAGQFAKPRTRDSEVVAGREVPAFRGLMVNSPEPDPVLRAADPGRMLECYRAAADAVRYLRARAAGDPARTVWTSHEALILDYEIPLVRRFADDRLLLSSTHWPWIGDRTRQPDGAHVRLLAAVDNPVACKVGPGVDAADLVRLCALLDPDREPGRLALVARLGAGRAAERLPALVAAVRAQGHPALWLCDPMHGNTVTSPAGLKTRLLTAIVQEIEEFCAAVRSAGGTAAGLHLEATAQPVAECVWTSAQLARHDGSAYTTLCDPRLDRDQALAAVHAWRPATNGEH